jgi:ubiquinone/menaquinone biosynthesis C-methylase UbiE
MAQNLNTFLNSKVIRPILVRFFDLLYHQFAWSYDLIADIVSVGLWRKWVFSICDYVHGPQVLELGFGPGHLQSILAASSKENLIYGLDASPQMCKIAKRRLAQEGLKNRLARGDAMYLPFRNSCFDQVLATFPSEYIFSMETLQEVKRVLKSNGSFIILFQAHFTGSNPLFLAAGWLFRITGQSLELDRHTQKLALDPFLKAGLKADIQTIEQEKSKLSFIFAKIANS